jgi:hypothetical protein
MPTKKGKRTPAKAKKASKKSRGTRAAAGSKRAGGARKPGASSRSAGRKRAVSGIRRTEAGPVWIGSSPTPLARPTDEPGDKKAADGESGRVVIL